MKPNSLSSIAKDLAAFAFVAVLTAGIFAIFYYDAIVNHNILEGGLTEKTQALVLLVSSILFFVQSVREPDFRPLLRIAAFGVLGMFIRETDGFFDRIVGSTHFWAYVELIPIAAILTMVARHWKEILAEAGDFFRQPRCQILFLGVVFVVMHSQLYGYKRIWISLTDRFNANGDVWAYRSVKNAAEEGMELLCYLWIFSSALLPMLLRRRKRTDADPSLPTGH